MFHYLKLLTKVTFHNSFLVTATFVCKLQLITSDLNKAFFPYSADLRSNNKKL